MPPSSEVCLRELNFLYGCGTEQDYASWSQVYDTPEGTDLLFADTIRRLQSRYFSPPQKTKLKGTGLNDNKGEFTLTIEEKHLSKVG